MPTLRAVRGIAMYGCAAAVGATYAYFQCGRWGHAAVTAALVTVNAAVALICTRILDRREGLRIRAIAADWARRQPQAVGATGPPAGGFPSPVGATGPARVYPAPGSSGNTGPNR